MHGGADNDAISGAEALLPFYNEAPQTDTDPLRIDPTTHLSAWWNPYDPMVGIPGFFLDFDTYWTDPTTGQLLLIDGGAGPGQRRPRPHLRRHGDDWMVGGTYFDWLFGGWGYDLLDARRQPLDQRRPQRHPRARGLVVPARATSPTAAPIATSSSATRRWTGCSTGRATTNDFYVPFDFYGAPTVNRFYTPAIAQFIRRLAYAGGTDVLLTPFEPYDEPAIIPRRAPGLFPHVRPAALARRAAQRPGRAP